MIMKNGKQIGFIYKNGKKIDKIIRHGKVYFEQGFTRELTSTTLPVSFNGIGKDLKDYKIYGNMIQSNLPKGYTQVEYIESSGTQYIDTNFIPDSNTSYNIDIELKTLNSLQYFISSHSTNRNNIYMNASSYASAGYGSSYKVTSESLQLNTRYNFSLDKNLFYINNNLLWEFSEETFTNTANCILFAHNTNGTINNFSAIKLYSCKIYDNNILIRDFIPCYRNSDNEIGLYDLVNNVFYINQGTGVFTYGNVIPTPDKPIKIINCGDKTKNLCFTNFDNWESGHYDTSGGKSNSASRIRLKNLFEVEIGETYYFNTFSEFNYIIRTYDENKNFISSIGAVPNGNTITVSTAKFLGITIYNPNNSSLVYSDYEKLFKNETIKPLICLNSKIDKTYEPYGYKVPININNNILNIYLNEPLRKIGEYNDYIDFKNKKVIRNIKELILNGSESWTESSTNNADIKRWRHNGQRSVILHPSSNNENAKLLSESFQIKTAGQTYTRNEGISVDISGDILIYYPSIISGPANFKTWLSNNNVLTIFALQTPIEENIELLNIPTIDGNNTLNIETEITPSQVYIKYKSNN